MMIEPPPDDATQFGEPPQYPTIVVDGIGLHVDHRGIRWPWSPDRDPPNLHEILAARTWLFFRCEPVKTPSLGPSRLKHAAERWRGRYVSRGAIVVAAGQLGWPMRVSHDGRIRLGVSRRAYRQLPEATAEGSA